MGRTSADPRPDICTNLGIPAGRAGVSNPGFGHRSGLGSSGSRHPSRRSIRYEGAMAGEEFVHLHVHTEYSMLDGAAQLKPLFAEAARLGMPAVAMTDHGNMFGAYEFFQQAAGDRRQADHRHRGLRRAGVPVPQEAGLLGQAAAATGERRRGRLRRRPLHPHDDVGAERRRPAQPVQAVSLASHRGLLLQAPDGPRADRASTPRGSSPPPAARPARCRPGCGWASTTRRSRPPRRTRTSSARRTTSSS